jgi:small redox-active disulfide protein 2
VKNIKILGPGCPNCEKVEKEVLEVLKEKGMEAEVSKVTDFGEIAKMGVLSTPGVVVDGEVKVTGRVPGKAELEEWLS